MSRIFTVLLIFTTISIISCTNVIGYDKIADVNLIIHKHFTQVDMYLSDGQTVWIDMVDTNNEIVFANIKGLIVTLSVRGYDQSGQTYTIPMFDRTYQNIELKNIDYPGGMGFLIPFDELRNYDPNSLAVISVTVTLPDGTIVKSHKECNFSLQPTPY